MHASGNTEQALRDSEARYRTLFEHAGEALFVVQDGRLVFLNPSTLAMTGYSVEELLARPFLDFIVEEDREMVMDRHIRRLNGEELPPRYAFRIIHRDGGARWVELNAAMITWNGRAATLNFLSDITERRQMEQVLRESEGIFKTLFQDSPVSILVHDKDSGEIIDANAAAIAAYGLSTLAELRSRDLWMEAPYSFNEALAWISKTVAEGGQRFEWCNRKISGELFWEDVRLSPVVIGGVERVLATTIDITNRKRAREALQQAEENYRRSLDESPLGVRIVSADGETLYANRTILDIYGFDSIEEFRRTPTKRRYTAESYVASQARRKARQRGGKAPSDYEISILRKDGEVRRLRVFRKNVLWDGKPQDQALYIDVTERNQAENIIRARLRLTEFAADHPLDELLQKTLDEVCAITESPIGFYHFVEPDQSTLKLQAWSTRTLQTYCKAEGKVLHYSLDQAGVWGDCVRERRPVIHNDYESLPHRKGLPEGHAALIRELTTPILRKGQIVAVLGVGNKAQGYTSRDVELVSYFADVAWEIAERKKAQEELQRLNEELEGRVRQRTAQLEAANKELESFSYSASHDLRAPLRSIDGFGLALLEEYTDRPLDETGVDYLKRIRRATQNMGQLIDDMLKLSRVTRTPLQHESVDLSGVVSDLAGEHRKTHPERAVEMMIEADVTVEGDPVLLKIMMGNLLHNAWKFTGKKEQARIVFGTTVKDGQRVCFVKDNGAGFDMAYAGKLFGAFQRLHTSDEFAGTGVGLATVQRILHRHGGRIWAEAEVGRGATFYFTLPV
jgi:PAS domain S-box-containing protein